MSGCNVACDVGPCTAIIARSCVLWVIVASRSPAVSRNQSSNPAELISTQYRSSANLYTLPSSIIFPSAFTKAP